MTAPRFIFFDAFAFFNGSHEFIGKIEFNQITGFLIQQPLSKFLEFVHFPLHF